MVALRRVRTMSLSGKTIVAGSPAEEQKEAPAAKKATRDDEQIRVRAREGEEVTMSREVARLAGHLKDLMDDASSEDGVYPVPIATASTLRALARMPEMLSTLRVPALARMPEMLSTLSVPSGEEEEEKAEAKVRDLGGRSRCPSIPKEEWMQRTWVQRLKMLEDALYSGCKMSLLDDQMEQYQNKASEELRYEGYASNPLSPSSDEHSLLQLMEHVEGALFLDAPMLLKHNQSVIASLVNGKNADELRALLGAGSDFDGAELEAALAESAFLPENYEAPQQLGAASSTAPHSKSTLDLLSAAEMGDHEALLKALKEGGDVSATDDKTMTALHWAARCGRPDDLKALLEAGASVNTATKAGVTALIYAASEGWDDCVPILLQAGADIAMPTNKGRTALQAAQEKAAKADAEERLRFDKTIRALASPVAARTAAPAAVVTPTQATASSAAPFTPLRQPSLAGVPATTDAREAALGMVGVATLCELKGVNRFWRALSRRVLCSRLCRGRGQPAPTHLEEITDLDVELLIEAGRAGDTALAGRMLPGLARLHGYGFVVDVAKVRAANLQNGDVQRAAKAALDSCISGDREAPLKLTIAAVACAGSGVACGIPVQHMREDTMTELDLRGKGLRGPAAMLISYLIPANGTLTRVDIRRNNIAGDGAKQLSAAVLGNLKIEMFNEIPIKEMRANSLTELDLTGKDVGVEGVMVVAGLIRIMGGLTKLLLAHNMLGEEGTKAICEALEQNTSLKELDIRGSNIGGSAGAKQVAKMVGVNGALTSVDLSINHLTDYGRDMTGIKKLAAALGVNGGLTELSISGNHVGDEGVGAICEAIKSNKETKLVSLNFRSNGIGPVGANTVAAMVAVTGALTSIDLFGNDLCGLGWEGKGIYTAEGITAIADALRVNGTLTCVDIRHNNIAGDSAEQLSAAVLGNLKIEMFNEIPIKEMRANSLTELDLKGKGVGVEGVIVVAGLMPVMGALTSIDLSSNNLGGEAGAKHVADMLGVNSGLMALDLSYNNLNDEGVSAVCEAIQSNKETKLVSLNMVMNRIGPVGAKSVAAMVAVTGTLTATNLLDNRLDAESAKMLAEVVKQKGISLCGIRRDQTTADFRDQNLKPPDAILLASDLSQAGVTGGLTSINLSENQLCGIWTDIDGSQHGSYTAEGITAIADALRVNGALTVTNLLGNQLDAASAKMLAEVAEQKGISLCGILRDQTTANFSKKNLKPPDAILLASDLSQAIVTGGLTSIDLSSNQLCGIWTVEDGHEQRQVGTYTAEGITAIADALGVNGGLTKME